jgi:hypothetical protein
VQSDLEAAGLEERSGDAVDEEAPAIVNSTRSCIASPATQACSHRGGIAFRHRRADK